MFRRAPAAAVLSLLGLVAWIYGAGLDRSPAYLVHEDLALPEPDGVPLFSVLRR